MVTHMVTAAWGDWHVDQLLSVNLPSLLAEDNLPAFSKLHRIDYEIVTTRADAARISRSPVFQRLLPFAEVRVRHIKEEDIDQPIATHHRVWREATVSARRRGALILFLPPDVVWAEGAFGNLARRISEGKRAIFNMYLRVVSETLVPEILERFGAGDGILRIPPRQLIEIGLRHAHPLMLCYLARGRHLPPHTEFLMWSVPGEGLLLRLLARELLLFDPSRFQLDENALLETAVREDDLYVVSDSDEVGALSLAPLWQDVSWYREENQLDPVKAALWWLRYDSPANTILSRTPIRFRSCEVTEEKWQAVERESARTIHEIESHREVLRIYHSLKALGLTQAARALGVALLTSNFAQAWDPDEPASFFVPTDSAIERVFGDGFDRMLEAQREGPLGRLILGHLVPGEVVFDPPWGGDQRGPGSAPHQEVRTRLGERVAVDPSADPPKVGDARLAGFGIRARNVTLYPIDAVLLETCGIFL